MAENLPLLPRFIENLIQKYAEKRLPGASNQLEIDRRRLYILPTRHGVLFFAVLLLILMGSINYENSLGYMLAFLLGPIGLLGMIYTHQNLNHLNVKIGRAESVFAGQSILFPVTITHKTVNSHPNIQLQSVNSQTINTHLISESTQCKLSVPAIRRGYTEPGRIKLFTEFPLGLFHAWSWLNLQSRCLVYPAPDPHHYPLLSAEKNTLGEFSIDKRGVDDFAGIRQYQRGDQPNHMAWKSIAKTGELQTKLFNSEAAQEIWIDWSKLNEALDLELRLSILCRMVLDAEDQSLVYGLNIPGTSISPSAGLHHKQHCLKSLALFGLPK